MSRSKSKDQSANFPSDATLCDLTVDKKAAKALQSAAEKYGHLVPTTIFRAADGRHLLVRVRCTVPGCETERIVATSDIWQCRTCKAHKGWDKDAAPKAPATKAEKGSPKGSKTKAASKGPRKASAPRKAAPRARRAKTTTGKGE